MTPKYCQVRQGHTYQSSFQNQSQTFEYDINVQ